MSDYIQVRDVQKSYDGTPVLRGVGFTAAAGERLALMGPSGSGKSTLLNCLGGIDRIDAGTLSVGGIALHEAGPEALSRLRRDSISTVFQFFHLLPTLTVGENAAFPLMLQGRPAPLAMEAADALLEQVGLSHRAHAFPDQLSGGEMQRCAIARALIIQPRLLLADEPTGNLDSATGESILDLLDHLTRAHNITLIMVTHSAAATRICDRIIHLLDGRVVEAPGA